MLKIQGSCERWRTATKGSNAPTGCAITFFHTQNRINALKSLSLLGFELVRFRRFELGRPKPDFNADQRNRDRHEGQGLQRLEKRAPAGSNCDENEWRRSLLNLTVQLAPTRSAFPIAAVLQPAPFAARARLPCRRTKPLISGAAVGRFAFGRTSRSGRPDDVGAALLVWLAGRSSLARGSMCDGVRQPRAGGTSGRNFAGACRKMCVVRQHHLGKGDAALSRCNPLAVANH